MIAYQAPALSTTGQVLDMALDAKWQPDVLGAHRANGLAVMEHDMADTDAIHGDTALVEKMAWKTDADTDT
jgi:hypothetical protein